MEVGKQSGNWGFSGVSCLFQEVSPVYSPKQFKSNKSRHLFPYLCKWFSTSIFMELVKMKKLLREVKLSSFKSLYTNSKLSVLTVASSLCPL